MVCIGVQTALRPSRPSRNPYAALSCTAVLYCNCVLQVNSHRFSLYNIFLLIPVGLARGLANRPLGESVGFLFCSGCAVARCSNLPSVACSCLACQLSAAPLLSPRPMCQAAFKQPPRMPNVLRVKELCTFMNPRLGR